MTALYFLFTWQELPVRGFFMTDKLTDAALYELVQQIQDTAISPEVALQALTNLQVRYADPRSDFQQKYLTLLAQELTTYEPVEQKPLEQRKRHSPD